MAVRYLMMVSVMVMELALAVATIIGISSQYRYGIDGAGAAGIVMLVAMLIVAWLVTIAVFIRKSSAARAARVVDEARAEAARIISEATDKAMALCSLDGPRCRQCGNPRTGRYCPKCGAAGDGTVGSAAVEEEALA